MEDHEGVEEAKLGRGLSDEDAFGEAYGERDSRLIGNPRGAYRDSARDRADHVGGVLEGPEEKGESRIVEPFGLGGHHEVVLAHASQRELVAAHAEVPKFPAQGAEGPEGEVAVCPDEIYRDARDIGYREIGDRQVDRIVVASEGELGEAVEVLPGPRLQRQGQEGRPFW